MNFKTYMCELQRSKKALHVQSDWSILIMHTNSSVFPDYYQKIATWQSYFWKIIEDYTYMND